MSTVVYLSNQQIQIVSGLRGAKSVSVKSCFMAMAPEGSIINGMITDTELFVSFLKDLWTETSFPKKDVYLVINSTKFVGQTIELPVMNRAKTLDYIGREFAELERGEERVHGYIHLANPDKKLQKVYAESITPDFLQEYIDIFAEAGIKLKGIISGESSIIALTQITAASRYKTFLLQIADKMTLSTVLWVNGTFYYYNSVRCFHEQGTEDYAMEISRSISQIIQFMQAHQIEYPLEQVLLAGVDEKDMELYRMVLNQQGIRIPFQIFGRTEEIAGEAAENIQKYLYAASGLFTCGNTQNFLDRGQSRKKRAAKEKNGFQAGFILIGITFFVMIVAVSVCAMARAGKKKELQDLKDCNENPALLMQLEEYEQLWARNVFLTEQHDAIVGLSENLETYPWCSREIMELIEEKAKGYASVSIDSFRADTGQISLVAKAEKVESINQFIKILSGQDIFYDVNYTGYQYIEGDNLWNIKVTCILSEAVGK